MAVSSLEYSSQFDHTPFYCEENVYFLCKKLCANGVADVDGSEKKQAYSSLLLRSSILFSFVQASIRKQPSPSPSISLAFRLRIPPSLHLSQFSLLVLSRPCIAQSKGWERRIQLALLKMREVENHMAMKNPSKYGFKEAFKACCGSDEPPYNFSVFATCGSPSTSSCPNPSQYINWDRWSPPHWSYV